MIPTVSLQASGAGGGGGGGGGAVAGNGKEGVTGTNANRCDGRGHAAVHGLRPRAV